MLSCQHYDYIEIACMYHYLVKLTLTGGTTIEGEAQDTCRNAQKGECIQLLVKGERVKGESANGETVTIELNNLAELEVLVTNPHFQKVIF